MEYANFERRAAGAGGGDGEGDGGGDAVNAKAIFEAAMAVERSKEGPRSKVYGVLVNQYAAFLDEALGDEDAARAVYLEAGTRDHSASIIITPNGAVVTSRLHSFTRRRHRFKGASHHQSLARIHRVCISV